MLTHLVNAGLLVRMQRGVYALPERSGSTSDAHRQARIRAHLTKLPEDVVVAHVSAAALHGLRTPYEHQQQDFRLHVLRQRAQTNPRIDDLTVVLPAGFRADHCVTVEDIVVTSLERTATDLARGCPFERALVAIDHALALGADLETMRSLRKFMRGWPGTRVLRPAIDCADARSESGLESIARGLMLASGLPRPELQVPITVASGMTYRVDMAWLAEDVIVEIDGRGKLDTPEKLASEKDREDDLRELGFRFVRLTYKHLVDPRRTRLHRLAALLGVELQPLDADWGQTPRLDPEEAARRRRRRRHQAGAF